MLFSVLSRAPSREAGFDHHLVKSLEFEILDRLLRDGPR
jgi:hypothetical protein